LGESGLREIVAIDPKRSFRAPVIVLCVLAEEMLVTLDHLSDIED